MEITKKLVMTFKTDEDKKVSLIVDDPRPNITEAEIIAAMQSVITNDIFAPNGESLVASVNAKVVETGTTEFDLVL